MGEAINPLTGEMDDFIMVTVLKEQVELEVWGMVLVSGHQHDLVVLEE